MKTLRLFIKLIKGEATGKDKISLALRILGTLSVITTLALVFIISISLFMVIVITNNNASTNTSWSLNPHRPLPLEVMRWEPDVRIEAERNQIPHTVHYLLIIIMLESGGRTEVTSDIMQASESQGLPPNTITCPFESIKIGVAYFASLYQQFPNHDGLNIFQAYNFGMGFLNYANYVYDFNTAVSFSRMMANGRRITYINPLATRINGGWRYAFGNMFYGMLAEEFLISHHDSDFILPVLNNFVVTSHFGRRIHPISGILHFHNGIDLVNPGIIDPPILATADGEVVFSGWAGGYGNYIVIKHDETTFSGYAHNSVNLVSVGDIVRQGEQIAIMGTTGNSTGIHAHFEIMINTTDFWQGHTDPAPLLGIRR